jgi:hypothetical protein
MDQNTVLIAAVQEWIQCDDSVKALQKKSKAAREAKKAAAASLSSMMDTMDVGTVNIGENDRIVKKERRSRGGLTKKYLTECLGVLFSHDAAQREQITNHIMDNRPVKVSDDVQRKCPGKNQTGT